MTKSTTESLKAILFPFMALGFVAFEEFAQAGLPLPLVFLVAVPLLLLSVFAAVYHAEVLAHRIGQPFGSVLLALAVTIIEVSLIVSVLLSDGASQSSVARDTVFAAIMIVLNGIVGICLFVGGFRFHQQEFQARSAASALGVLGTLAVLGLILPNYTLSKPGPVYAPAQLVFVAIVSLALYGLFLFVQTVRHKDDFIEIAPLAGHGESAPGPSAPLVRSLIMLPVALLAVILIAEMLAPSVETIIRTADLPEALVGVVIAMIVLLPEGVASIRAAAQNHLQTSLNLALGSALASLCLTIPAVALLSIALDRTLVLGLAAEHMVLLILSLFATTLSLMPGRTTILQGGIHLVIFFSFIAISALP